MRLIELTKLAVAAYAFVVLQIPQKRNQNLRRSNIPTMSNNRCAAIGSCGCIYRLVVLLLARVDVYSGSRVRLYQLFE